MYSTLPHMRNTDSIKVGLHYDNKVYERFEPLMTATQHAKYDKHKFGENDNLTPVLTTFGHKRSPSGESLGRNIHLAGAKLVLPTGGEMPTLKPVDKNLIRPKLPPPGPPSGSNNVSGTFESFRFSQNFCFTEIFVLQNVVCQMDNQTKVYAHWTKVQLHHREK